MIVRQAWCLPDESAREPAWRFGYRRGFSSPLRPGTSWGVPGRWSCPGLPGERGQVRLGPGAPGPLAGQRRRPVEPGQQALVEQGRVLADEAVEVRTVRPRPRRRPRPRLGGVVADQLDPGPADG